MENVGILLAAGRGTRFDASGVRNKLLQSLPDGTPVALQSARNLLACLPRVLAVVGPHANLPENGLIPGLVPALREAGCEVTVCAQADTGMGASLAHAVREAQSGHPSGWLIALADMPFVQPGTIEALLAAAGQTESSHIIAPWHQGQRGHPVLFRQPHLADLLALQGDRGAASLFKKWPCHPVVVTDPGVLQDIDTPDDLKNYV
jgi:molybdenum cofactor cytidylyltransferase